MSKKKRILWLLFVQIFFHDVSTGRQKRDKTTPPEAPMSPDSPRAPDSPTKPESPNTPERPTTLASAETSVDSGYPGDDRSLVREPNNVSYNNDAARFAASGPVNTDKSSADAAGIQRTANTRSYAPLKTEFSPQPSFKVFSPPKASSSAFTSTKSSLDDPSLISSDKMTAASSPKKTSVATYGTGLPVVKRALYEHQLQQQQRIQQQQQQILLYNHQPGSLKTVTATRNPIPLTQTLARVAQKSSLRSMPGVQKMSFNRGLTFPDTLTKRVPSMNTFPSRVPPVTANVKRLPPISNERTRLPAPEGTMEKLDFRSIFQRSQGTVREAVQPRDQSSPDSSKPPVKPASTSTVTVSSRGDSAAGDSKRVFHASSATVPVRAAQKIPLLSTSKSTLIAPAPKSTLPGGSTSILSGTSQSTTTAVGRGSTRNKSQSFDNGILKQSNNELSSANSEKDSLHKTFISSSAPMISPEVSIKQTPLAVTRTTATTLITNNNNNNNDNNVASKYLLQKNSVLHGQLQRKMLQRREQLQRWPPSSVQPAENMKSSLRASVSNAKVLGETNDVKYTYLTSLGETPTGDEHRPDMIETDKKRLLASKTQVQPSKLPGYLSRKTVANTFSRPILGGLQRGEAIIRRSNEQIDQMRRDNNLLTEASNALTKTHLHDKAGLVRRDNKASRIVEGNAVRRTTGATLPTSLTATTGTMKQGTLHGPPNNNAAKYLNAALRSTYLNGASRAPNVIANTESGFVVTRTASGYVVNGNAVRRTTNAKVFSSRPDATGMQPFTTFNAVSRSKKTAKLPTITNSNKLSRINHHSGLQKPFSLSIGQQVYKGNRLPSGPLFFQKGKSGPSAGHQSIERHDSNQQTKVGFLKQTTNIGFLKQTASKNNIGFLKQTASKNNIGASASHVLSNKKMTTSNRKNYNQVKPFQSSFKPSLPAQKLFHSAFNHSLPSPSFFHSSGKPSLVPPKRFHFSTNLPSSSRKLFHSSANGHHSSVEHLSHNPLRYHERFPIAEPVPLEPEDSSLANTFTHGLRETLPSSKFTETAIDDKWKNKELLRSKNIFKEYPAPDDERFMNKLEQGRYRYLLNGAGGTAEGGNGLSSGERRMSVEDKKNVSDAVYDDSDGSDNAKGRLLEDRGSQDIGNVEDNGNMDGNVEDNDSEAGIDVVGIQTDNDDVMTNRNLELSDNSNHNDESNIKDYRDNKNNSRISSNEINNNEGIKDNNKNKNSSSRSNSDDDDNDNSSSNNNSNNNSAKVSVHTIGPEQYKEVMKNFTTFVLSGNSSTHFQNSQTNTDGQNGGVQSSEFSSRKLINDSFIHTLREPEALAGSRGAETSLIAKAHIQNSTHRPLKLTGKEEEEIRRIASVESAETGVPSKIINDAYDDAMSKMHVSNASENNPDIAEDVEPERNLGIKVPDTDSDYPAELSTLPLRTPEGVPDVISESSLNNFNVYEHDDDLPLHSSQKTPFNLSVDDEVALQLDHATTMPGDPATITPEDEIPPHLVPYHSAGLLNVSTDDVYPALSHEDGMIPSTYDEVTQAPVSDAVDHAVRHNQEITLLDAKQNKRRYQNNSSNQTSTSLLDQQEYQGDHPSAPLNQIYDSSPDKQGSDSASYSEASKHHQSSPDSSSVNEDLQSSSVGKDTNDRVQTDSEDDYTNDNVQTDSEGNDINDKEKTNSEGNDTNDKVKIDSEGSNDSVQTDSEGKDTDDRVQTDSQWKESESQNSKDNQSYDSSGNNLRGSSQMDADNGNFEHFESNYTKDHLKTDSQNNDTKENLQLDSRGNNTKENIQLDSRGNNTKENIQIHPHVNDTKGVKVEDEIGSNENPWSGNLLSHWLSWYNNNTKVKHHPYTNVYDSVNALNKIAMQGYSANASTVSNNNSKINVFKDNNKNNSSIVLTNNNRPTNLNVLNNSNKINSSNETSKTNSLDVLNDNSKNNNFNSVSDSNNINSSNDTKKTNSLDALNDNSKNNNFNSVSNGNKINSSNDKSKTNSLDVLNDNSKNNNFNSVSNGNKINSSNDKSKTNSLDALNDNSKNNNFNSVSNSNNINSSNDTKKTNSLDALNDNSKNNNFNSVSNGNKINSSNDKSKTNSLDVLNDNSKNNNFNSVSNGNKINSSNDKSKTNSLDALNDNSKNNNFNSVSNGNEFNSSNDKSKTNSLDALNDNSKNNNFNSVNNGNKINSSNILSKSNNVNRLNVLNVSNSNSSNVLNSNIETNNSDVLNTNIKTNNLNASNNNSKINDLYALNTYNRNNNSNVLNKNIKANNSNMPNFQNLKEGNSSKIGALSQLKEEQEREDEYRNVNHVDGTNDASKGKESPTISSKGSLLSNVKVGLPLQHKPGDFVKTVPTVKVDSPIPHQYDNLASNDIENDIPIRHKFGDISSKSMEVVTPLAQNLGDISTRLAKINAPLPHKVDDMPFQGIQSDTPLPNKLGDASSKAIDTDSPLPYKQVNTSSKVIEVHTPLSPNLVDTSAKSAEVDTPLSHKVDDMSSKAIQDNTPLPNKLEVGSFKATDADNPLPYNQVNVSSSVIQVDTPIPHKLGELSSTSPGSVLVDVPIEHRLGEVSANHIGVISVDTPIPHVARSGTNIQELGETARDQDAGFISNESQAPNGYTPRYKVLGNSNNSVNGISNYEQIAKANSFSPVKSMQQTVSNDRDNDENAFDNINGRLNKASNIIDSQAKSALHYHSEGSSESEEGPIPSGVRTATPIAPIARNLTKYDSDRTLGVSNEEGWFVRHQDEVNDPLNRDSSGTEKYKYVDIYKHRDNTSSPLYDAMRAGNVTEYVSAKSKNCNLKKDGTKNQDDKSDKVGKDDEKDGKEDKKDEEDCEKDGTKYVGYNVPKNKKLGSVIYLDTNSTNFTWTKENEKENRSSPVIYLDTDDQLQPKNATPGPVTTSKEETSDDLSPTKYYYVGVYRDCKEHCEHGICDSFDADEGGEGLCVCVPLRVYHMGSACGNNNSHHILREILQQEKFKDEPGLAYLVHIISMYGGFLPPDDEGTGRRDDTYLTKHLASFLELVGARAGGRLTRLQKVSCRRQLQSFSIDTRELLDLSRDENKRDVYQELFELIKLRLEGIGLGSEKFHQEWYDVLHCQILNQDSLSLLQEEKD